jgi:peptidoglycan/xylan/chitin deacetylase (PgdA/CDA1 family)
MRAYYRVRITLSFDNGPIPGSTDRILDILKARGLRATFFALGRLAAETAGYDVLIRAKAEGHWVGNHTMNHGTPLGESKDPRHVENEIEAAERVLGPLALPQRLFRPNGGGRLGHHLLSPQARQWLAARKYTVVTWNNVPGDWIEPRRGWVERALETAKTQDWSLLVLHDPYLADMMDTLPAFLDEVQRRGGSFTQDFPPSCVINVGDGALTR